MTSLPADRPAGLHPEYVAGCDAGELRLQCCAECGHVRFPPSPVCPVCLSTAHLWQVASGAATLWSWVRVHQRYFQDFYRPTPYAVGFVELAEGPMMMSGVSEPAGRSLRSGMVLRLRFEDTPLGRLPWFDIACDETLDEQRARA
jgi:uncharacterized protein